MQVQFSLSILTILLGSSLTACQSQTIQQSKPNLGQKTIVKTQQKPVQELVSQTVLPAFEEQKTILEVATPDTSVTSKTDGNTAKENNVITSKQLQAYHWKLISAVDHENRAINEVLNYQNTDKKLTDIHALLDFNNDTYGYSVGCNSNSTPYQIKDNVLSSQGSTMSTMMSCLELDHAETALGKLLQGSNQLTLKTGDLPILTMITDDNATLVWQGNPTARTRFGSEPETLFFAISPETKPCDNVTTRSCLQVKPVKYINDKKIVEGDWTLFDGAIEGYNHSPDEAQIIRVERYLVAPNEIKGKTYAYVLSGVIESERVTPTTSSLK